MIVLLHGIIGIDGGGSHTEAVLCANDGTILSRAIGGPASGAGTDYKLVKNNLHLLINDVMNHTSEPIEIDSIFAGISGCGVERERALFTNYVREVVSANTVVEVDSDIVNPVYAVDRIENVVVAICGTGSIATAITPSQRIRVDGHGFLLGDDAGGFWIGRKVLHAILRQEDGRGPDTQLATMFYQISGKSVMEMNGIICDGGKMRIASYAPIAFKAALAGDSVAQDILMEAAANMAESIDTAAKYIELPVVPVIMSGSLWQAGEGYLRKNIQRKTCNSIEWITPNVPLVYGAVKKAAEIAKITNFKMKEMAF